MEDLSESEKEHILNQFDKLKDQMGFASDELADLIKGSNSKLIECQHEIILNVIGKVYEENTEGETISAKHICQKNYHIPVPPSHDYNDYLNGFFAHLEQCIIQSASVKDEEDTANE
jgi:hypothetical protein